MNKGKLAFLFRKLGLIHTVDRLKYRMQLFQNRKENQDFKKQHPDVALPPDYMMFEAFRLNYARYYLGGMESAKTIFADIAKFTELKSKNILDWGCGPARIIRHLPTIVGNNCMYFGTDYNKETINWCKANIKDIDFRTNQLAPPLKYADSFFDVIYGISIFTHLSEKHHYTWYDELIRVSKQGAIIYLTTHGDAFKVNMTENEKKAFDSGQLVVRSNAIEGHRVYAAFHPVQYIQTLFETYCEILSYTPGKKETWGISQDTWIIRKK